MMQMKQLDENYTHIWEHFDPQSLVMLKNKIKPFRSYETYAIWITKDVKAQDINLTLHNHKVHANII